MNPRQEHTGNPILGYTADGSFAESDRSMNQE
jgi:hypothetical protein